MSARIFIIGVTGYIGGHLLEALSSKHPDFRIVALVRKEEQAQVIKSKYSSVGIVVGDLDSEELLVQGSKEADIVIQTADADHTGSVKSIIKGLSVGGNDGTFIQVSGTASVIDTSNGLGQATTRVWDDIVDLQEISTFDHAKIHAITDQLVLQEGKEKGVRTALVLPAGVYGTGKGPIKTSSMGIPWLVEGIRTRGKAFKLGAGQSISSTIHIEDLISALILLTEQALEPQGGSADWGEKGVYFVEGGSYVFVDLATALAKEMHKRGIISTAEVDEISEEDITAIHPWGALIWGSNMRARASRLRSLGWKPEQLSAIDAVEEHLL